MTCRRFSMFVLTVVGRGSRDPLAAERSSQTSEWTESVHESPGVNYIMKKKFS